MALTDEGGMNTTMLVSPSGTPYYGGNGGFGNGFGQDGWWIILLLLLVAGGWNNGNGWGGNGGNGGNGFIPYAMNTGNDVQRGFDQAAIMGGINSIASDMCNGFSNVQQSLCNGFAGVNQTVANGFSQAEIANNARQIADMQQMFALQSSLQNCCCENRAGLADLKYTVATENCADRTQSLMNTRDIIESQTRSTQSILDKLCQLELDGVKAQVDAKNDRIAELQTQLNIANLAASQTAQTAQIQRGQVEATAALVNELRSCPIPAQPVFGSTPIFQCNGNNATGCGCGA